MDEIIKFEDPQPTFEDFKNQNGIIFWWASDMMRMLGYPDMKAFQRVIDRATKAFISLDIQHHENIISTTRVIEDKEFHDFKLTRFACYMVAMNGNPQKPEVALAQKYFVEQTRKFEILIENSQEIERLVIRDELTDGNKSLCSTAKKAGVSDFAKFQNAGYLGMYNMENWKLAKKRGIDKGKLLDYMGRTELAANLFRITQTEEYIKNKNITGQIRLEEAHKQVGRDVRNIIVRNTGKTPENLPQAKVLPEVKKEIKQGYKKMKKADDSSE